MITTQRIEALTDGIFAISMTLLVLNLEVPANGGRKLAESISGQGESFFDYGLSFFLLASFWLADHRRFVHIKRADGAFLWLAVASLSLIALVPFTTSLFGQHRDDQLAAVFFEGNLMLIGLVSLASWIHATRGRRLVDRDLSESVVRAGRRINLVTPAVSVVAIGISFISPSWSTLPYALIPPIMSRLRPGQGLDQATSSKEADG